MRPCLHMKKINQSRIHKCNFKWEYLFQIKYRCRTHSFRLTASSQFSLIYFESKLLCAKAEALILQQKHLHTPSSSSRPIPRVDGALFLTDRSLLLCLLSLKAVKSCWYWKTSLLYLNASQARLDCPSKPAQHERSPLAEQYFSLNFSPLKAIFLPLGRISKMTDISLC